MKIYGLTPDEKEALKKLADEKFGKPSISSLARHLLINELLIKKPVNTINSIDEKNQRHVIRISKASSVRLAELAKSEGMSVNRYIIMLLHAHLHKEPTLTMNEVKAVQHSNYQLYKIGVNINQIAKALNSLQSANLSSRFLKQLHESIDKHFTTIGNLIQKSKERY